MRFDEDRFVPAVPANVERALHALKQRLEAQFGSGFVDLRLFGSFARGEQHDESDVDVLILFAGERWDDDALFRELAAVDVEHRVWISPVTLSKERYQQMVRDEVGIALAIEEEGIPV